MSQASADTERMLIGGLIKGGKLTKQLEIGDFSYYADIYSVITTLIQSRKTVDFANVSAKLTDIEPLIDCARSDGRAALVDNYAEIIHANAVRRNVINTLRKAEAELEDPLNETTDIVDAMRDTLIKLTESNHTSWTSAASVMQETIKNITEEKERKSVINSASRSLDSLIGGFYGGEMTVIGARPAVGKSAFALHIGYNAAVAGKSVGILSREMSDTQLGSRLLSKASGINGMKLRTRELDEVDAEDIKEAADILSELDINFLFGVRNVEDLRRMVQARQELKPLDILIIDYLQLMDTSKSKQSEHLRVGEISRTLKEIALDYHIPVIALAQVNRDTDGMMPGLKNLKDSGSIEQDADGVIFLHKPESAQDSSVHPDDKASFENWKRKGYDYIVLNVAKQRQGQCGKVAVLFDHDHMNYIEIPK